MGTLLTGVGVGLTVIGVTNILELYPSDLLWIEVYGIALNLLVWVVPGLFLIVYNDRRPADDGRNRPRRQLWDDAQ